MPNFHIKCIIVALLTLLPHTTNAALYLGGVDIESGGGSSSGDLKADGTVPLTASWDVGAFNITAARLISDVAGGTAPFGCTSTTVVPNLNVSLLEGVDLGTLTDTYLCRYDLAGTEIDCNLAPTTYQTADADLTTYAGITPSANIQTLLGSADFAAARTNLSLVPGTNVQAYDADLATYAGITPGAFVQIFLDDADEATFKATVNLEAGTDFYSVAGADTAISTAIGTHTSDGSNVHGITDTGLVALGVASATDGAPVGFNGTGGKQLKELTSMEGVILVNNNGTSVPGTGDQASMFQKNNEPYGLQLYASPTTNVFTRVGTTQKDWAILTPADADDALLFKAQVGMTISDIHCIIDPADSAESITLDIQECDATGDNCATVDAAITCDNDGAEDDGTFTNGSIDAGDWVKMVLGAPSGTVSTLTFSVYWY